MSEFTAHQIAIMLATGSVESLDIRVVGDRLHIFVGEERQEFEFRGTRVL